jgi:hypothetical protein
MHQFLTTNLLCAFSNADEDEDNVMHPTVIHQAIHVKLCSISEANAPTQPSQSLPPLSCSFPPAMPIKTELDKPSALSPLHHFESMYEIIERQNWRSRREHHSKCKCDMSPSMLPYSPTHSSLHASGYSCAATATCDLRCAKAIDDSLPSDVTLSQVSHIHT